MKTQGSWISFSSVHTWQPRRRERGVTRRGFVIAKLGPHELKTRQSLRWRRDNGVGKETERCCGALFFHLLVVEGNLRFDFQDQIRCGIPQLPDVLIDVVFYLQPHIVIHVPAHRGGGKEGVEKITTKNPMKIGCWGFIFLNQSKGQNRNQRSNLQDGSDLSLIHIYCGALAELSVKYIMWCRPV